MSDASQPELRVVVRPNRSLPAHGAWVVFGAVAGGGLVIGTGFAIAGAWPVLPFLGLEVLLVGAVLWYTMRHRHDHELVIIGDERLAVRRIDGRRESGIEFQRYWARARLERGSARRTRLVIGSHGRWIEVGGFLAERRRRALYRYLRRVLRQGPAGEARSNPPEQF